MQTKHILVITRPLFSDMASSKKISDVGSGTESKKGLFFPATVVGYYGTAKCSILKLTDIQSFNYSDSYELLIRPLYKAYTKGRQSELRKLLHRSFGK